MGIWPSSIWLINAKDQKLGDIARKKDSTSENGDLKSET
jgi:hypothetical protein